MEPLDDLQLGATDHVRHLATAADHRHTVLAMTQQAKRTLHIYSHELDPAIYDNEAIEAAFTQFALRSQKCRIQILVQDTAYMVKQGHAVLRLAHKLSSRVQIKLPSEEFRDYSSAFFVADVTGFIRQPVAEKYVAESSFSASFESRKLVQYFNEVWERADTDPQLRRLHL